MNEKELPAEILRQQGRVENVYRKCFSDLKTFSLQDAITYFLSLAENEDYVGKATSKTYEHLSMVRYIEVSHELFVNTNRMSEEEFDTFCRAHFYDGASRAEMDAAFEPLLRKMKGFIPDE